MNYWRLCRVLRLTILRFCDSMLQTMLPKIKLDLYYNVSIYLMIIKARSINILVDRNIVV